MFKLASTLAYELSEELIRISEKVKTPKEMRLINHIFNFVERRTF